MARANIKTSIPANADDDLKILPVDAVVPVVPKVLLQGRRSHDSAREILIDGNLDQR
jgi:hypothetical protein